ncbi:urease accessory protein UreD [Anabaena azotica]|uniref:Urease accessory protein UreD n=1 Tax=Anabaena azotica FACHB-119 TaxID=947527 RepID=A0ABR8D978_9NOST|nr:urease accessory protein UreD [Anabaena azotica]MBD2503491.1 urease accessory protein UreD [Anabaena azotica FACHB-119]
MVLSLPNLATIPQASQRTNNLELRLKCDKPLGICSADNRQSKTIVSHQYAAYPLSVSPVFRLDGDFDSYRAYLYMMSTSPGLLAGDEWKISLQLEENSSLYLTEQAATKVHSMPIEGTKATINYNIEIGAKASLEFIPEPLILFADAVLEQTINIKIHPTGQLCLSEIILPGRLARGESYQFHHYLSRLQVRSTSGELWFTDAMYLEGKLNPFTDSHLFTSSPVLGSLFVVLPEADLAILSASIEDLEAANCSDMTVASSILPHGKGLLIRAIASGTHKMKMYLKYALNCVRRSNHQPPLPYSL